MRVSTAQSPANTLRAMTTTDEAPPEARDSPRHGAPRSAVGHRVKADRPLGRMASGVSHRARSPPQARHGFAELGAPRQKHRCRPCPAQHRTGRWQRPCKLLILLGRRRQSSRREQRCQRLPSYWSSAAKRRASPEAPWSQRVLLQLRGTAKRLEDDSFRGSRLSRVMASIAS